MGLIPDITCWRCGHVYSGVKSRCPRCKAPRSKQTTRAARSSVSYTEGTASHQRAEINGRWQLIFAALMVAAVILAVVVLAITGGDNSTVSRPDNRPSSAQQGNVSVSDTYLPSPQPTPSPTPESEAEPKITSMEMIFYDSVVADITLTNPGEIVIDLDARVFPQNQDVVIEWSSSNENVMTVDHRGIVTVVGANPSGTVNATISAKCEGLEAKCIIYVPYHQAAYLTENKWLEANGVSTTPTQAPGTAPTE